MVVTKKKLKGLASKGYEVAFKNKSKATQYQKLLRKEGYKSSYLRSSGPTIDAPTSGNVKSYYIIPEKIKKKRSKIKKMRKSTSNVFGDFKLPSMDFGI